MAEKHQAVDNSPERRRVPVSPNSASSELSASGSTNLQPFSVGRASSSGNLSSVTVPVRLDVLYFLLNSAARGAQCALPPSPIHGGHGLSSQCPVTHCSCHPTCHSMTGCAAIQPSDAPQGGRGSGGYGRMSVGVRESQHTRGGWNDCSGQPSGGRSYQDWREAPSGEMGWRENQRGNAKWRGNRDSWQGRRQDADRYWGDQRPTDSAPWKSTWQDRRNERFSFGSSYGNRKRAQETTGWQTSGDATNAKMPWDAASRRPKDDFQSGWPKSMEDKAGQKASGNGLAKTTILQTEEDWESDYKEAQAVPTDPRRALRSSQPKAQAGEEDWEEQSVPTPGRPQPTPAASLLLEPASEDPESSTAAEKGPTAYRVDWNKSDGFASYLRQLYSDVPMKSSSEGSADLVIDTDVESSKPGLEEPSLDSAAGGGSKSPE